MSRSLLKSALIAAALAPLFATAAYSDGWARTPSYGTVNNGVPVDAYGAPHGGYGYNYAGCYPQLNAPLYSCPRPDVPYEVGRTLITNPALSPHEMLYPHKYRALYPPYYYQDKCGLACLPFFPKPSLKGTEVTVKYKSHHGLFDCFYPAVSRVSYSNRGWK
jgi:hypothetical protein